MQIEYGWTEDGRRSATHANIAFPTVVHAIAHPTSIEIRIGPGPDTLIFLGGIPGALAVITLDRAHHAVAYYEITNVRAATPGEIEAWNRRNS